MPGTRLAPLMAARTPLYDRHLAAGARMVEFGGYEMPLQYSTIRDEHIAVRERAGVFDLSHMGEVRVRGRGAEAAVQQLIANDVSTLAEGGARYGVMCNRDGGIVDDVVAYREGDTFLIVVNAACREKDVAWMRENVEPATSLDDESAATVLIAVQGPRAAGIVGSLSSSDTDALKAFHSMAGAVAGVECVISRTGYTGEDGFELYARAEDGVRLWDAVIAAGTDAGLLPCGLGARDTLRLEAGLRLYGQDMDDNTDPFSCGLGWTVKLDKGDFIGRDALLRIDPKSPPRRFIGLRLPGRSIARHGQQVRHSGDVVGDVTSGTFSFTLGHGIATASVLPDAAAGRQLDIDIRGTAVAAEVVPLPFYRRPKGA